MNAAVAVGIAGPLLGLVGVVLTLWFRRKPERQAAVLSAVQAMEIAQGSALEMLQPLRAEITHLHKQVADLKSEVVTLTRDLADEHEARMQAEAERDRLRILLGAE